MSTTDQELVEDPTVSTVSVLHLTASPDGTPNTVLRCDSAQELKKIAKDDSIQNAERAALFKSLDLAPPEDKDAASYGRLCSEHFKHLVDVVKVLLSCTETVMLNSEGQKVPKPPGVENKVVELIESLTFGLPGKDLNFQEDKITASHIASKTLPPDLRFAPLGGDEDFAPEQCKRVKVRMDTTYQQNFARNAMEKLFAILPNLRSLTLCGLPPSEGTQMLTMETAFKKVRLPASLRALTLKDECPGTVWTTDTTVPWHWELDNSTTDLISNFTGFDFVTHLRYVACSEPVRDAFAFVRVVSSFEGLKYLRIDNIPPLSECIPYQRDIQQDQIVPRVGGMAGNALELLELRPRKDFLPNGIFTQGWIEWLRPCKLRRFRIPLRNVFEVLQHTTREFDVHLEVIVSSQELTAHHHEITGAPWICAALKILEELSSYFESAPSDGRSLSFVIEDIYAEDRVWTPTKTPYPAWKIEAFESVEYLPAWLAALPQFVYQPISRANTDAETLFEYIEGHCEARGNLGVKCNAVDKKAALLETLSDSDEETESLGYISDDGDDGDEDEEMQDA